MGKIKRQVKRISLRDIYQTTECDKCGSKLIYFKTKDNSHIMCIKCTFEIIPLLESVGYEPIWGITGWVQKLPRAMRIWSLPYE